MKPTLRNAGFALICLTFTVKPPSTAPAARVATVGAATQNREGVSNAKDVIRNARAAQYNLPKQGMQSFRCSIAINWEALYKQLGANADSSQALVALLQKTRFKAIIGPDGSSSLSRESDEPPPNAEIAERLRASEEGVEQTITGLFKTWAGFMVGSMLPEADDKYNLALVGGKYLLTYGADGTDIAIDFNSNLAMERVSYKSAKLNAEFKPMFETNPNGFVLSGYAAEFDAPAPGVPTHLEVSFENQTVDGLELPHVVTAKIPFKDTAINIQMTFSDFQVTKK
jgi:hypothetical protein